MRPRNLVLATLLAGAPCPAQDAFVWQTDLAAARQLAAEQRKPLLLLFRCER